MADWEQPSTSMAFSGGAGGRSVEEQLAEMRRDLALALDRVDVLERRVSELEEQVAGKGQAQGV